MYGGQVSNPKYTNYGLIKHILRGCKGSNYVNMPAEHTFIHLYTYTYLCRVYKGRKSELHCIYVGVMWLRNLLKSQQN